MKKFIIALVAAVLGFVGSAPGPAVAEPTKLHALILDPQVTPNETNTYILNLLNTAGASVFSITPAGALATTVAATWGALTCTTLTASGTATFNGSMAINGGQSNASGQNALFNGPTTIDSFNETNAQLRFRNTFALDASGGTGIAGRDHSGSSQDGVAVYGHDGVSIWTTQTSAVLVNSSGNVTIDPRGASTTLPVDLASTTKKLYVNGATHSAGQLSAQLAATIGSLASRSDIFSESAVLDIGADNSGINGVMIHNLTDSAEVAMVKQNTGLIIGVAGDATASDNKISIRTEETASSFSPTERILISSGGAVSYTPSDAGTTSVTLTPGALDADATIEIEVSDGTGPASATGSLAGAAVNDVVLLGPPADLEPGLAYRARVSATGVVKIIFQNLGASTVFAGKVWKIKLIH